MAKFTADTIQPFVEMLIDAIENKGASSSGVSYNSSVVAQAKHYRSLLSAIRNKEITKSQLLNALTLLRTETMQFAGNNQSYRIREILKGLDFFMLKEYNKVNI